jgi:PAS domain-containing protein
VCADVAIPAKQIADGMSKSDLLDVDWLTIAPEHNGEKSGALRVSLRNRSSQAAPHPHPQLAGFAAIAAGEPYDDSHAHDAAWVQRLESSVNEAVSRYELASVRRRISVLRSLDGEELAESFLVPLGRSERGEGFEALLVTPRVRNPSRFVGVATQAGFGFLATLFIVLGVRRARADSVGLTVGSVLRSIRLGIVIINEEDLIESANDRAEQIAGVLLPKFGPAFDVAAGLRQPIKGPREYVHELLDDWIIESDNDGKPTDGVYRYAERIPALRKRYRGSNYYARLRKGANASRWIWISATPISEANPWDRVRARLARWLHPLGETTKPRVLAVVDVVISPTDALDAKIDKHRPASTASTPAPVQQQVQTSEGKP